MIQNNCKICGMTMIEAEGCLLCPCCGAKEKEENQKEQSKKVPYYFKEAAKDYAISEKRPVSKPKEKGVIGFLKRTFDKDLLILLLKRFGIPMLIGVGAAIFVQANNRDKKEVVPDYEVVTSSAPTELPADGWNRRKETPDSPFFQELVAQLFEKAYDEVTPEEYEKVISICLQKEETGETTVICGLSDGTEKTFTVAEQEKDNIDLQCFVNLEAVDIGEESLDYWDLRFLENIKSIGSGTSLSGLRIVVSDPTAITELKLYGTVSLLDLDYLSEYKNLKVLSMNVNESADLSVLEELPYLEEVYINGVLQE